MASPTLERGRHDFERGQWVAAYDALRAADEASLQPDDMERLATAAYMVGEYASHIDVLERAHSRYLEHGDEESAARCAFWIGFGLLSSGELSRGGGWMGRAGRLVEQVGECSVSALLMVLSASQAGEEGDHQAALTGFAVGASMGERLDDPDVVALARVGKAITLSRMGDTAATVALMDEVMVAVTADGASPIVVGSVYCGVIEECHQVYDLRRAQEWTVELSRWCGDRPDMAPYRGQCLVRRAEIMQLHGAWADAIDEAERARGQLDEKISSQTVGSAFYRQAEVHRLRGERAQAEEGYRRSSECGCSPHPGLALLRLQEGDTQSAAASMKTALNSAQGSRARAGLLGPYVEIALAAGDVPAALAATTELADIAAALGAPYLAAAAAAASGAVKLADGEVPGALGDLRAAWGGVPPTRRPLRGSSHARVGGAGGDRAR